MTWPHTMKSVQITPKAALDKKHKWSKWGGECCIDWSKVQMVFAMDWIVSPSNSSVKALTSQVTVLETGPLERWLRLNGFTTVELWFYLTGALIETRKDITLPPLSEDTARKWSSSSQKESRHQNIIMWISNSSLKNCEKVNFVVTQSMVFCYSGTSWLTVLKAVD